RYCHARRESRHAGLLHRFGVERRPGFPATDRQRSCQFDLRSEPAGGGGAIRLQLPIQPMQRSIAASLSDYRRQDSPSSHAIRRRFALRMPVPALCLAAASLESDLGGKLNSPRAASAEERIANATVARGRKSVVPNTSPVAGNPIDAGIGDEVGQLRIGEVGMIEEIEELGTQL